MRKSNGAPIPRTQKNEADHGNFMQHLQVERSISLSIGNATPNILCIFSLLEKEKILSGRSEEYFALINLTHIEQVRCTANKSHCGLYIAFIQTDGRTDSVATVMINSLQS